MNSVLPTESSERRDETVEIERKRHKCPKMGGKFAIQKYWLDRIGIEDVMEHYGLESSDGNYGKVRKIVEKSKKDFRNGWSFFTREDIDRKILVLCMND